MKKADLRELNYEELVNISGGGPGKTVHDIGVGIGKLGGWIANMVDAIIAAPVVTDDQWMIDVPPQVLFG